MYPTGIGDKLLLIGLLLFLAFFFILPFFFMFLFILPGASGVWVQPSITIGKYLGDQFV